MAIIRAGQEKDTVGTSRSDKIYGSGKDDALWGNGGNDRLWGYDGADEMDGGSGNDWLSGGSGDDGLWGYTGRDTLTGGDGADGFFFDTNPGRSNVDTITDFRPKVDAIALDNDFFKGLGRADNYIKTGAFRKGSAAQDADDRIIYNNKTGAIYYDVDGTGFLPALQFAKIDKNLKLSAKDFFVYSD